MLKNRNIIVFSDDWGRYPSTLQHICKILIKSNKLIWIGSLGLRKPKFTIQDFKRVIEKIKKLFSSKLTNNQSYEPNITILNPFVIPYHDFILFRLMNNYFIAKKIKKFLNENSLESPIIFTSSPIIHSIISEIKNSSSWYFCLDDYTKFEGAFSSIEFLEKELLKEVDGIFAVSQPLLETKKTVTGKNFFLPQGVDVNHFARANDNTANPLQKLSKPIVGFFGLISAWIDVDLIFRAAEKLTSANFVVIGKIDNLEMKIPELSNLHFIGAVPFNELPCYSKNFDVGLIPFKINELTMAVNPLKLLEYFATGIPVVSTAMPEVAKFGELVYISDNEEEFVQCIEKAINEKNEVLRNKRIETAKKISWEFVSENISQEIEKRELEKSKR